MTDQPRPKLAIIGYSDFTKLIIRFLSPHVDIVVASRQKRLGKGGLRFEHVDLETALSQRIIIPCMPAQFLEEFFTKNKAIINPQALIIDVCSVKSKPVKVLKRVLPKTTEILATHPMFGPASAGDDLTGKKIMLYPVRIAADKYVLIREFLHDKHGLRIIETTPEEHDRSMAYVQGLSHYIGRAMQLMEIPNSNMSTSAYDDLLDMKRIQGMDSWELFESIMFENPYAMDVHDQFKKAINGLDQKLGLK